MTLEIFRFLPAVEYCTCRAVSSTFVEPKGLQSHLLEVADLSREEAVLAYASWANSVRPAWCNDGIRRYLLESLNLRLDGTMLERRDCMRCLLCLGEFFFEHAPLGMHRMILSLVELTVFNPCHNFRYLTEPMAVAALHEIMVTNAGFQKWLTAQLTS